LIIGEAESAGGGIEGGEEFIFGDHFSAGEGIEEGGFAGVGVTDDGSERPEMAAAAGALGGSLAADQVEVLDDSGDSVLDTAAVGFELGFAVAAHADAAFLSGEMGPEAGEAREEMLELGQFDLEFAFAGAGALGEDVEDEGSAVEHFAFEEAFEVSALGRRQFIVEDDGIDFVTSAEIGELAGFTGADEGGGDRG
jgi:hypothetical protein